MPTAKKTTSTVTRKTAKRKSKPVAEEVREVSAVVAKPSKSVGSFVQKLKNPYVYVPVIIIIVGAAAYLFRGLYLAAVVNGQFITRSAYVHQLEVKDGKTVLSDMVTQVLIEQEAKRRNISVSQKEVDDATKQISDQLAKQGQTLDAALAARGMTKDDFTQQLHIQKLLEKMLSKDITVSDKEIADYIQQNKDAIPSTMSEADVNATVKQQLTQQKLNDKAQALVAQLQQKAKTTYFVNY